MEMPQEGEQYTPEQWRHLFINATEEQQLHIAALVITHAERAMKCFMEDHDGAVKFSRGHQCEGVESAYRRGGIDAMQRFSDELHKQG